MTGAPVISSYFGPPFLLTQPAKLEFMFSSPLSVRGKYTVCNMDKRPDEQDLAKFAGPLGKTDRSASHLDVFLACRCQGKQRDRGRLIFKDRILVRCRYSGTYRVLPPLPRLPKSGAWALPQVEQGACPMTAATGHVAGKVRRRTNSSPSTNRPSTDSHQPTTLVACKCAGSPLCWRLRTFDFLTV